MVRFRLPSGSLRTALRGMIDIALDASYLPPLTDAQMKTGIVSVPAETAAEFYASTKRMGVVPV